MYQHQLPVTVGPDAAVEADKFLWDVLASRRVVAHAPEEGNVQHP